MDNNTSKNKTYSNFVPALREPAPQIIEIDVSSNLPAAPVSAPMPYSSHLDRARGFSLATLPLAAATGFIVLLIGISAFGVPLLSVGALLLALAGFAAVWLGAFIVHTFVSADGAMFLHVFLMWNYLNREAKERHKRYNSKGRD